MLAPRGSVDENRASTYAADDRCQARGVSGDARGGTTPGARRAAGYPLLGKPSASLESEHARRGQSALAIGGARANRRRWAGPAGGVSRGRRSRGARAPTSGSRCVRGARCAERRFRGRRFAAVGETEADVRSPLVLPSAAVRWLLLSFPLAPVLLLCAGSARSGLRRAPEGGTRCSDGPRSGERGRREPGVPSARRFLLS